MEDLRQTAGEEGTLPAAFALLSPLCSYLHCSPKASVAASLWPVSHSFSLPHTLSLSASKHPAALSSKAAALGIWRKAKKALCREKLKHVSPLIMASGSL